MDGRKVVRFQLDNGEWRSKVYYPQLEKEKEENQEAEQPLQMGVNFDSVWSKPKYDTDRYESYIHYLCGFERLIPISKPKPKPTDNKPIFNRKINVSWGKLQPELDNEEQQFSAQAHRYSARQLIDILNNDIATRNIERLSKMSREDVEKEYKSTNRIALSNRDDIENRVNKAFLKGEGLEDVIIGDKVYQGLLFDASSAQSQLLKENDTFKDYYANYLSCIKEIISEAGDTKEIDIDAISDKLSTKLEKPNFSKKDEIDDFDYYGLMGGTQNTEINFEIAPTSNGEYNLKTKMYINDWYGADKNDINNHTDFKDIIKNISKTIANLNPLDDVIISNIYYRAIKSNLKNFIPGLDDFFWLQHHYGCKPFPTQIIYKSEDKIKLDN